MTAAPLSFFNCRPIVRYQSGSAAGKLAAERNSAARLI